MRNILTNIRASQEIGSDYDPDFQAWIDYNILQGHYITSDTVKLNAANQYVIDSKADGTWQGKDVELIFAWNDLNMADASLVCMKRLVKATVYGGCTYTVNGWEGNAVDGYINLNYSISASPNFNQIDFGWGGLIYGIVGTSTNLMFGNSFQSYQIFPVSGASRSNINIVSLSDLSSAVNFDGIGLKTGYRDSSTNVRIYNSTNEYIRTQSVSTTYLSQDLLVGRSRNTYFPFKIGKLFVSKSFTQSENESIRTNLNTYLTSIGLTPIA